MGTAEQFKEMVKQVLMDHLEVDITLDKEDQLSFTVYFDGDEIHESTAWIGSINT